ncbi:hypothetical protein EV129_11119 [Rhizobium azibense]|uniref:Uncharacterized protein n=1 Tax=Rhizobium azibense TaxID=1136135 RepID=A0A4R3RLY0_9HYPH|nr:hypothetical protein EV129_11119 [Rhizobium azibense]
MPPLSSAFADGTFNVSSLPPLPSSNPLLSSVSVTKARWGAFVTADAPWLVRSGISSLVGRYPIAKTRLQLTIFSRIPCLYKIP